jgi:pimeloyl-ACP methyl ester carboxylesterase
MNMADQATRLDRLAVVLRPGRLPGLAALILALFWAGDSRALDSSADPPERGDYVVLLHGLCSGAWSMKGLERDLNARGFRVINASYRSTRVPIETLANIWLDKLLRERVRDPAARVHFVTHSMGGLVLREYLSGHKILNLGRVVMLAPPNHGSELADQLKRNCLYRLVTGPAGQQLGSGSASLPNTLGPADFELGIIAGQTKIPLLSRAFPGPNDGLVAVQSARLDGMSDFLLVHHSHWFMPWARDTRRAAVRFVETGHFKPSRAHALVTERAAWPSSPAM